MILDEYPSIHSMKNGIFSARYAKGNVDHDVYLKYILFVIDMIIKISIKISQVILLLLFLKINYV